MSGGEGRNWLKFFRDAGIPEQDAVNYAISFESNRIKPDHLQELSRDLLTELGITKVGDAIAVRKQAREFHHQEQRKIVMTAGTMGDEGVSSTHPDSTHLQGERKPVAQQPAAQWEWSENQLQRVARQEEDAQETGHESHYLATYPQQQAVAMEGVYGGEGQQLVQLVPSEPLLVQYHEHHHGDVTTMEQGEYPVQVEDPNIIVVGATYEEPQQLSTDSRGMYSDKEDSHVTQRVGSQALLASDPSSIQRRVFAGNTNPRDKAPPGGGGGRGSGSEADRTVFTRLGEKKSGSRYYFDRVLASSSGSAGGKQDESVFRRLSGSHRGGAGGGGVAPATRGKVERDTTPSATAIATAATVAAVSQRDRSPILTRRPLPSDRTGGSSQRRAAEQKDLRRHLGLGRREAGAGEQRRAGPPSPRAGVRRAAVRLADERAQQQEGRVVVGRRRDPPPSAAAVVVLGRRGEGLARGRSADKTPPSRTSARAVPPTPAPAATSSVLDRLGRRDSPADRRTEREGQRAERTGTRSYPAAGKVVMGPGSSLEVRPGGRDSRGTGSVGQRLARDDGQRVARRPHQRPAREGDIFGRLD